MQLPLGVFLKNENCSSEMIEIMDEIQKYVPITMSNVSTGASKEEFVEPFLFGSDQLTCERGRNSQRHRKDLATQQERLDGLTMVTEDWHARMNYFEVYCSLLHEYKYTAMSI